MSSESWLLVVWKDCPISRTIYRAKSSWSCTKTVQKVLRYLTECATMYLNHRVMGFCKDQYQLSEKKVQWWFVNHDTFVFLGDFFGLTKYVLQVLWFNIFVKLARSLGIYIISINLHFQTHHTPPPQRKFGRLYPPQTKQNTGVYMNHLICLFSHLSVR